MAGSFWLTLQVMDRWSAPDGGVPSSQPARGKVTESTAVESMPKFPSGDSVPGQWVGSEGVNAAAESTERVGTMAAVRLIPVPSTGSHFVEGMLQSLAPNKPYRLTILLKQSAQAQIFVQVHDQANRNSGVTLFDLAKSEVLNPEGNNQHPTIQSGPNGWLNLSMDTQSADGALLVRIGFMSANDTTFTGDGLSALLLGAVTLK